MRATLLFAGLVVASSADATPTKLTIGQFEKAGKAITDPHGPIPFERVYKRVVALLGAPHEKKPAGIFWYGWDHWKCTAFHIRKNDDDAFTVWGIDDADQDLCK